MMDSSTFARTLTSTVTKLFGPIRGADSLPPATIEGAEKRLGLRLPEHLRDFYLMLGNHQAVNKGLNHFLSPSKLRIESGAVIFCEENQRGYYWAIKIEDVGDKDPKVLQGIATEDWSPVANSLGIFLVNMVCWHAINVLNAGGECKISTTDLQRLSAVLPRATDGDPVADGQIVTFAEEGLSVCVFPRQGTLDAAAESDDLLKNFEERFRLSLSWF